MKKQFATYKISSDIRELGFDEECIAWYNSSSEDSLSMCDVFGLLVDKCSEDFIKNSDGEYVTAPLWQQVIDWFRENKKIHISLPNHYDGNSIDVRNFNNDTSYYSLNEDRWYENYYEAREQAILKAIEIIKKKKSDETNN